MLLSSRPAPAAASALLSLALLASAGKAAAQARTDGRPAVAGARPVASPAATLQIELDRPRVLAGETEALRITVVVQDAAGNPADAEVAVEAVPGTVGPVTRLEKGRYRAELAPPTLLGRDRTIYVQARAGRLFAASTVRVAPGPPATIALELPERLVADGATRSQGYALLVDAFGNAAEEGEPDLTSDLAELGQPVRIGAGRWMFSYRPRLLEREADDVVRARAEDARAERTVHLTAPVLTFDVAPMAGVALQGSAAGPAATAEATVWTRLAGQELGLAVQAGWWLLGTSGRAPSPAGDVDFRGHRNYVPVGVALAARWSAGPAVVLGLSLGAGVSFVAHASALAGQPTVTETGWAPMASAALRCGVRAWGGLPFLEARASWLGDPGLSTLHGTSVPFFLLLGYRFHAG